MPPLTQMGVDPVTGKRYGDLLPPAPEASNPYGIVGNANLSRRVQAATPYGEGADAAARQYAQMFGTTTPQARNAQGLPPIGNVQGFAWTRDSEANRYA